MNFKYFLLIFLFLFYVTSVYAGCFWGKTWKIIKAIPGWDSNSIMQGEIERQCVESCKQGPESTWDHSSCGDIYKSKSCREIIECYIP